MTSADAGRAPGTAVNAMPGSRRNIQVKMKRKRGVTGPNSGLATTKVGNSIQFMNGLNADMQLKMGGM